MNRFIWSSNGKSLIEWSIFRLQSQLLFQRFSAFQNAIKAILFVTMIAGNSAHPLGQLNQDTEETMISTDVIFKQILPRSKRDEDAGSVFGKGVAFFLGEPCESSCNQILFHVWCNISTHRCECLPEFPVNLDNKYCLKSAKIDEQCEFSESCQHLNRHSECYNGHCKCSQGYFAKFDESRNVECAAYDTPFHIRIGNTTFDFINNMEFITLFSLTLSFILIIVLFFLVVKLINKNQQMVKNEQQSIDRLPPPPPVILSEQQYFTGSLESSPHSYRNLSLSDKAKYQFVPALPLSNLGSRRQSFSSLQSQSSIKSYSSVRSQSSFRNYRPNHCPKRQEFYRKASSPFDSFNNQTTFVLNHLPNNSHMRTKCSNTRCGSGSKIKSEICLVHSAPKFQEELFVPN